MSIKEVIIKQLNEIADQRGVSGGLPLEDKTVLLETGVDSLGFAILVTKLELTLGYDPFTLMDEPVYPVTFGEFAELYERFSEHRE